MDFSNRSYQHFQRDHDDWDQVHNDWLSVQTKKKNTAPEIVPQQDASEKEADDAAAKVVNGEDVQLGGMSGASSNTVQRDGTGTPEPPNGFHENLNNSKGAGASLDSSTQAEMESKMDTDFSGVKIHTGSTASGMAEGINAKAFTHGQDIYFGQGQYNPQSKDGKELLVHELVHTNQQGSQIHRKIKLADKKDRSNDLKDAVTAFGPMQNLGNTLFLMGALDSPENRQQMLADYKETTGTSFDETAKKSMEDKNISEDDYQLLTEITGSSKERKFLGKDPKNGGDYATMAKQIFDWKKLVDTYVQEKSKETDKPPAKPDIKVQQVIGLLLPLQRDQKKITQLDKAYAKLSPGKGGSKDYKSSLRPDLFDIMLFAQNSTYNVLGLQSMLVTPKAKDLDLFDLLAESRKKSPTAEAIISDLEKSPHTHTVYMQAESNNTLCSSPNKTDGSGTTIHFDFSTKINEGPIEDLKTRAMVIILHEFGHAWRYDRGVFVEVPKYPFKPLTFDLNPFKKKTEDPFSKYKPKSEEDKKLDRDKQEYYKKQSEHNLAEETEASHIENMVRAELDPDQKQMKLREKYGGIGQTKYTPGFLSEGTLDYSTTEANVIKPDFDYYKKGEEGKKWSSIHEQYGIKPR